MKPFAFGQLRSLLSLGAIIGCGTPPPSTASDAKPHGRAPTVTMSVERPEDVKPGVNSSVPKQQVGTARKVHLPDAEATVALTADLRTFQYFSVVLWEKPPEIFLKGGPRGHITFKCDPNPNCLAVPMADSDKSIIDDPPHVIVRVPLGAGTTRPESITIQVEGSPSRKSRGVMGGIVQRFHLRYDKAKKDENSKLVGAFQTGLAEYLSMLASSDPFVDFAKGRIQSRTKGSAKRESRVDGSVSSDLAKLMNFYTGRSEVIRTLQADRGLGVSRNRFSPTVRLESIAGVSMPKRDYEALMASDDTLSPYQPAPLAAGLPTDAVIGEFATIGDLLTLPKMLDARFEPIGRALEQEPGAYRLMERYREQLIVEPSRLGEELGQVAVGAAAVVIGDPYLREGTDVSLVLDVKNAALVQTVLRRYLQNARLVAPALETKTLKIEGSEVTYNGTPDGRFRQYAAYLPQRLILSNSPKRLEQLLRIALGRAPSLSTTPDYRWARRIAPYDPKQERAHLFFGDSFVAKVTGPVSKILEARRTKAQLELRTVDYAALLHGIEEGRLPANQGELLASGWLKPADLKHFDGATIAWSPEQGATSVWGRASEMIPIVDRSLGAPSREEADAYGEFRRDYEREMSGALDPTSIRILRGSEKEFKTELRILPLSPSGNLGREFREIVRNVGRGSVEPGSLSDGLGAVLAISQQSPLRGLAQGMLHGSVQSGELGLGFLGDWVKVGLADDPFLMDVALSSGEMPELTPPAIPVAEGASDDSGTPRRERIRMEDHVDKLPLWAAVQVKSGLLFNTTLAALRIALNRELGEWITWKQDGLHHAVEVNRVDVKPSGGSENGVAVYYALAKDVLLLSLQRRIIELRIDDVLAGNRPKARDIDTKSKQLVLDWGKKPNAILSSIAIGMLDQLAVDAHARACEGLMLLSLGVGEQAATSKPGELGLRYLGYEPVSPSGPGLRVDGGVCYHPVFGSSLEPTVLATSDARSQLHQAIESIRRLSLGLGVVPRLAEQELFGTIDVAFE